MRKFYTAYTWVVETNNLSYRTFHSRLIRCFTIRKVCELEYRIMLAAKMGKACPIGVSSDTVVIYVIT